MDTVSLSAQLRDPKVTAKRLRSMDKLPAEYYGHGVKNISLVLDYQSFRKAYRKAGDNTLIDLQCEGAKNLKVLVQRVDYNPKTNQFSYVEFINVRMDEEVTTHLPIVLVGQAPAVKEMAGTLIQNLDAVEVRCLPSDLIHEIEVDVSSLVDFHHAIHVSDIKLPAKITCLTDLEETVATVTPPKVEEETPAEERSVDDVGVSVEKGKGEEEAA